MEGKKKVIVVDDDLYFLQSTKERLIDDGYNAITANTISKAKEIIAEHADADVVVLDIMMPSDAESDLETQRGYRSGLVLARWVKQNHPKISIVGISGVRSLDIIDWFKRNNIPFFNKGAGEFIEELNQILRGNDMQQDLHTSTDSALNKFHKSAPLASWIFGGLILAFLMLVVFVDINPSKFPIIRFLMALTAAFFAFFFVGGVLLEGTLKGLFISATGGFVLFILIQFVFDPFMVRPTFDQNPKTKPTPLHTPPPTTKLNDKWQFDQSVEPTNLILGTQVLCALFSSEVQEEI
jgi:CheY-like chemotaxis protein